MAQGPHPGGPSGGAYAGAAAGAFIVLTLLQNAVYDYTPQNDALIYLQRARTLASGGLLDPALNWNLAPGYSLFLALPLSLGLSAVWMVAALQAACLAGSYLFVVRALQHREVLGGSSAALAVAAFVLNPSLWAAAGTLLSEAWVATLLLTAAGLIVGRRPPSGLALGTLAAASAWLVLSRFEYLAVLPLLALLAWRLHGSSARRSIAVVLLVPSLALGLNAWRNEVMFARPTPFSFGGGVVAYAGANRTGDGSYHPGVCTPNEAEDYLPPELVEAFRARCPEEATDPRSFYPALDSLYRVAAAGEWRRRPLDVMAAWPSKLARLWLVPGPFDIYTADRSYRRGIQLREHLDLRRWPLHGVAKHVVYFAVHWSALLLIALGLREVVRTGGMAAGTWCAFTLSAALLLSGVLVVFFYGLPRFHIPLLILLLPWTGLAAQAVRMR